MSEGSPPLAATVAAGRKRSLSVAGHRTSISLEEPFWDGLKTIARAQGCSLAEFVASVDAARGSANLSSALRVRVLAHYRALAKASENA
jgi:predicted DNA-binding ribbon-helix-helix protein